MLSAGKHHYLQIVGSAPQGFYLDGGQGTKVLLPRKYVPEGFQPNDWLDVFIYHDSEARLVATTQTPLAKVNECTFLKVVDTNDTGAFLDWGLDKDLLVPYREQPVRFQKNRHYPVFVYLDKKDGRITASGRLDNYLLTENDGHFRKNQSVDIMIWRKTELGFLAIVEKRWQGLLYANEVFQPLRPGQQLPAFIKSLRQDGRIDLTLNQSVKQQDDPLLQRIIDYLQAHQGVSGLTDKSPPNDIYQQFAVSKAHYKRALGRLYKMGKITISPQEIRLTGRQ